MDELLQEIKDTLPSASTECLISEYINYVEEYIQIDTKPNVMFAYIQLLMKIEEELNRRGFGSVVKSIKQDRNVKM